MFEIVNIPATVINFFDPALSHREVALGVCLAMLLAFVPWNGFMAVFLFLIFFIIRVNRISTFLTVPLFKLLYTFGLYRIAERLGAYALIDAGYLTGFWRWFISLPVVALLGFNNTLVAGGVLLALASSVPVYALVYVLSSKARPAAGKAIFASKFGAWARRIQKVSLVTTQAEKLAK